MSSGMSESFLGATLLACATDLLEADLASVDENWRMQRMNGIVRQTKVSLELRLRARATARRLDGSILRAVRPTLAVDQFFYPSEAQ